jgi:hypothetical protein
VAREGKTQLETLIDRARDLCRAGSRAAADVSPAGLARCSGDASSRDVYTAMARFANVNVVFDPTFRDQSITIDLRNASLEDALALVSQATRNFYSVTAQRTSRSSPTHPPSGASTRKRSSARSI